MSRTLTKIGPEDHGRRMSLDEFDQAEGREGYLYELSRGVITVTDVPAPRHLAQVNALKRQIHAYDLAHPDRIHTIASGSECKILLAALESEPPPRPDDLQDPSSRGRGRRLVLVDSRDRRRGRLAQLPAPRLRGEARGVSPVWCSGILDHRRQHARDGRPPPFARAMDRAVGPAAGHLPDPHPPRLCIRRRPRLPGYW